MLASLQAEMWAGMARVMVVVSECRQRRLILAEPSTIHVIWGSLAASGRAWKVQQGGPGESSSGRGPAVSELWTVGASDLLLYSGME